MVKWTRCLTVVKRVQIGVYMDNRLVYTLEGGAWKPIPLDRLVDKAKAAPP